MIKRCEWCNEEYDHVSIRHFNLNDSSTKDMRLCSEDCLMDVYADEIEDAKLESRYGRS